MIRVSHVTKRFDTTVALQNLSVAVPDGSVFGLLGPNGAGKTTLLRLLVGLLIPDAGQIELRGCAPHQVGYLPERPHFPGSFRLREYLIITAQVSGLDRQTAGKAVQTALEQTGLLQLGDRRISACSKGMLQRLGVAQALLIDPPLLLLDEPLSGLDPAAQAAMRHLVRLSGQAGKTIVVSTHRLSDVTQLCSHIAILSHGRLARSGLLSDVMAPRAQVVIRVDNLPQAAAEQLAQMHPSIIASGPDVVLPGEAMAAKTAVLRVLLDAGVQVLHLEQQRATLEEIYLEAVRSQTQYPESIS